jgi:hypothetical protein
MGGYCLRTITQVSLEQLGRRHVGDPDEETRLKNNYQQSELICSECGREILCGASRWKSRSSEMA